VSHRVLSRFNWTLSQNNGAFKQNLAGGTMLQFWWRNWGNQRKTRSS